MAGSPAVQRRNRDPAGFRSELQALPRAAGHSSRRSGLPGAGNWSPRSSARSKTRPRRPPEPVAGRAVLTVPASYGRADQRRRLLISAAEATGLRTVELLPEPGGGRVRARDGAAAESRRSSSSSMTSAAGPLDTALVRIGDGQHEVLGSAALDDCGGLDLDAVLTSSLTANTGGWLQTAFRGKTKSPRRHSGASGQADDR